MEFNIDDPRNIVGISPLMSDDNSRDILELERQIINGTNIQEEEDLESKKFKREMDRLAKTYDLDGTILEDDITVSGNVIETNPPASKHEYEFVPQSVEDNQLKYMTMEQKKQTYVNDVLNDISDDKDDEFNMDNEREEDDKNLLLEQIDMLRMQLEDDGTDIRNIPIVNKSSNIIDIQNIYKRLKLKNNRNRYCSFAEELLLAGAYGMEYLFDGEKDWFGRKPDLVGWSKTVQVKLKRCRYQTSTFVKEIMEGYNMSSGMQLLIELVPSMFLFSRRKKLATQENKSSSDLNYKDACSNLNNL